MKPPIKISESYAIEKLKELCSRAEKSEYDICKRLSDWGLYNYTEKILSILRAENYIDNVRFAKAFAIDKIRLNKWGKYKVRMLLRGKNISDTIIREAFEALDDEEYHEIVNSELKKKMKSLKIDDPYKLKAKIYAFGNQRGYENDLINEFLSIKE